MKRIFRNARRGGLALVITGAATLIPLRAQGPVVFPTTNSATASAPVASKTPVAAPAAPVVAPVTPAPATNPAPNSTSTAALANEDIRDIRGPKAVASPELWFLWLAGGAILAALAYGAWRWYRHIRTAPRLPYEIALARLEKARALMTEPTAREFSIEVSEIVRSYIEARFKVRAAHQTTEEFLHNLLEPSDALLTGHRELLGDFLHHCDLAKFARWILSLGEMEEMHGSARTFVLETGKPATASAVAVPAARLQPNPVHAQPASTP